MMKDAAKALSLSRGDALLLFYRKEQRPRGYVSRGLAWTRGELSI